MSSTITTNQNYFQPTGFKVVIDRLSYPNIEFFAQSVDHPSVSAQSPNLVYRRVSNIPVPADTLDFSELSMQILLDEDLKSYTEIYDWMTRNVNENYVQQGRLNNRWSDETPSQSDITVSMLTSNNTKNKKIVYKSCVPTSLGGLNLNASASNVEYLPLSVTFAFVDFEITD